MVYRWPWPDVRAAEASCFLSTMASLMSRALIEDKGGSDTGGRAVRCPSLQNIPWFMTKSALYRDNVRPGIRRSQRPRFSALLPFQAGLIADPRDGIPSLALRRSRGLFAGIKGIFATLWSNRHQTSG
jgi:hypothetical protein